jgi:hypothetical protein
VRKPVKSVRKSIRFVKESVNNEEDSNEYADKEAGQGQLLLPFEMFAV